MPAELLEEVRPRIQVVAARLHAARCGRGAKKSRRRGGVRLGQRVRHGKFGEGTDPRSRRPGQPAQVQVNFERQGTKWLMLAYANLEPV